MVQPSVLLGLDLGASKTVAVVAVVDETATSGRINLAGAGMAPTEGGLRNGEITDITACVTAIQRAVDEAMRAAGQQRVDAIQVSVDGIQFKGENLRDSITVASPGRVITKSEVERVQEQATNACKLAKEEFVLHKISQLYHIKGQRDIRNPINMIGDTLEAEVRIIVAPGTVVENIQRALVLANLTKPGVLEAKLMYSPLASAEAVLNRDDAENGAVVVDIGEHLTHLGVFMRGSLFHSAVIPVGGMHFTRDLEITKHLGGIAVSEKIKRKFGTVLPTHVPPEDLVDLEEEGRQVSRRELAEVLHARAVELLNLIQVEIARSGLIHEIHGGIHLVGGGSLLPALPILAQNILGRPRVLLGRASLDHFQGLPQVVQNPYYTNALGAVKGLARELQSGLTDRPNRTGGLMDKFKNWF